MGRPIKQLSDLQKQKRNIKISHISKCHHDLYSRASFKNSIFNMISDGLTFGYSKNKYGSKFLLKMPDINISQDLYSIARIKLDLKNTTRCKGKYRYYQ